MEDNKGLSMLIGAFLLIILGAVFLTVLSDLNWEARNTYLVSNETIAASNATTTAMAHQRISNILYVTNATGTANLVIPASNYTATTGSIYNMYNGLFRVNGPRSAKVAAWGDVNVTYKYNPPGLYVRQSNARVLLNLIPLFFVIALLLFVVMPILKKFEVFG